MMSDENSITLDNLPTDSFRALASATASATGIPRPSPRLTAAESAEFPGRAHVRVLLRYAASFVVPVCERPTVAAEEALIR